MIRVREAKERATELKRIEKQRSRHQGREGTPTPTLGPIGLNWIHLQILSGNILGFFV